ncbi:interleukin-4 receptor subunit alpha-like [Eleutherodactylus coqui]|uniref:interleukin-4 receptor subunit alpha-like n=1 Tax=Eleutherodactylus coqui TaxID=57060 RepID=UPI0034621A7D
MSGSRMKSEIIQIGLLWITALLIAPSHSHAINNLDCVNDFDRTMVCSWEVANGVANCSSDFKLKCTDFENKIETCQDLDTVGGFQVPTKCICSITFDVFICNESFHIEVESQGQSVRNATIHICSSVKPKPPTNVRVTLTEPEYGCAQWQTNYEDNFMKSDLSFNIQFISKEDNKMVLDKVITQIESQYPFNRRQLLRGHDYRVRVRTKVTRNVIWGEWSSEVIYRNDYDLTLMDLRWPIVSVFIIVFLVLLVSAYFCIIRAKEIWWNNIPNPARSKLAGSGLIQKNYLKPPTEPGGKKSCGNWLGELVKAHRSNRELITKELLAKDYQKVMENNMKSIIFEPEKVNIETCIQLYSREDNLYQEDLPEDMEEDIHLMATDMSIGRMFGDILGDPSMKSGALEEHHVDNTFGSFGSSILRDNFHKTQRNMPLSIVSQESGYQSYDSEDSPVDSKLDGLNSHYLDNSSLNQGDFLPYAPVSSINESGSLIGKEDPFVNSGYNSFASALGELNYHSSLQNPKSILYYNTRCLPTRYEDDLRPTIASTSSHRIELHRTSVFEEPGYQSFNQAIQQGDKTRSTTSLVFDSGYKPFESPTRISTSSLDSINDFSELNRDLVQNDEDLQQTGMVNGGTNPWNDTQSSGFPLTEFNFFDGKYPFFMETLKDEHKGIVNQALDIHYGINSTSTKADKPFALTFDIGDHLRNFANTQELKMLPGLQFPTDLLSFESSLDEAQINPDVLLDKNGLHPSESFPMKFENMSYFSLLYHLKTEHYSHLLVQQNNMDEEGNSYMKIALW